MKREISGVIIILVVAVPLCAVRRYLIKIFWEFFSKLEADQCAKDCIRNGLGHEIDDYDDNGDSDIDIDDDDGDNDDGHGYEEEINMNDDEDEVEYEDEEDATEAPSFESHGEEYECLEDESGSTYSKVWVERQDIEDTSYRFLK